MDKIAGGKSIEQTQALLLYRQRRACPVCGDPISPGTLIVYRLGQLVHKNCGICYVAPNDNGTPFIHPQE